MLLFNESMLPGVRDHVKDALSGLISKLELDYIQSYKAGTHDHAYQHVMTVPHTEPEKPISYPSNSMKSHNTVRQNQKGGA